MPTTQELIDQLIACWSAWDANEQYYLTVLAPNIVRSDGSAKLKGKERNIVPALRQQLTEEEWQQLPSLIAQRRAQKLREPEERARRRKEAEYRRREIEMERARQQRERRRAEEARLVRKETLVARLKSVFESDFLSADQVFATDPDAELLSRAEYDELRARFVQDWAVRDFPHSLDSEQLAAMAAIGPDVQVVARAGSGKTRTLVARAIFLQKHCMVSPHELLLLAFNKKAAEEMKSRLAQTLGEDVPHVMTFHALAYALVHPEEDLVFDDASSDQFGRSRVVQDVIDEQVRSGKYESRIQELMLAHFREDWERIVDGGFQLTMDEFLAHRRSLPRESLRGEYVKSYGEKVIANALFEHSVEYRYERNFRWNGANYRPDFTIRTGTGSDIIIEYFGIEGDAEYDQMSQQKRQFWAQRDETFLEFSPEQLARNGEDWFVQLLLEELEKAGVSCRRRSEEEIWQLIRKRAIDRFTTAVGNFVSRCRKLNLSPNDLESMVMEHASCSTAEALFLDVGVSVYRDYLQRLTAGKKQDFDGLMWHSVAVVRQGETSFVRDKGRERGDLARLRFVMIDEFQDFSQMFFELIDATRAVNPRVQFFCVGDDWQAINGFAGSELRFSSDFTTYFRRSALHHIHTNYRSPRLVVEASNALMDGRGLAATSERVDAGALWLCKLDDFTPSAAEQARHHGDEITPAVLRLLRHFLDRGLDVVMLSRRNGVPGYVSYREPTIGTSDALERFLHHIRSYLPEEDRGRVTISTAHRYKGLEMSAVVVLDAVEGSYPLIHPNWMFLRIFGDSIDQIEAEERRLFYVAVTRAMNSLALLTETRRESPYLKDICRHVHLAPLSWTDLPSVPSLDGARVEVRVFGTYHETILVKDQLKDLGYQWNYSAKYWHRAMMAEGFSFDALLGQPWARGGVGVEVYSETGQLLHRR